MELNTTFIKKGKETILSKIKVLENVERFKMLLKIMDPDGILEDNTNKIFKVKAFYNQQRGNILFTNKESGQRGFPLGELFLVNLGGDAYDITDYTPTILHKGKSDMFQIMNMSEKISSAKSFSFAIDMDVKVKFSDVDFSCDSEPQKDVEYTNNILTFPNAR